MIVFYNDIFGSNTKFCVKKLVKLPFYRRFDQRFGYLMINAHGLSQGLYQNQNNLIHREPQPTPGGPDQSSINT